MPDLMKELRAELFAMMREECGEVIQADAKISRFGMHSWHPVTQKVNRLQYLEEMVDIYILQKVMFDTEYKQEVFEDGEFLSIYKQKLAKRAENTRNKELRAMFVKMMNEEV